MTGSYILIILLLLVSPGINTPVSFSARQEGCISCHGDMLKKSVIHPELAATCDICHTPTGEEHPKTHTKGFTLSEKLPTLCFNCHTDFQEKIDAYASVHDPVKDAVSCINCHNPHSSSENKLLTDGTNDLCLKCHNKTIVKDSVRISNISQTLSRAKTIHPPVTSGGCVTCHNPHFSEKRKLLIGNYPADQYVKASADLFELCFMCHDTDLLEKRTTETGTNFRNGKDNLHFVHLNGEKGRSCTMCHDVHGAAYDRLIVDRLKFGKWEMKISFSITENGGSCITACHNEKTYDRTIPKPPVVTEKKTRTTAGKPAAKKKQIPVNTYKKGSKS
jgi:predicted CXXCH cytochrome family protein